MTAPLITFYGDDFTGSSAVMEVLGFAGLRTMLFLDVPDAGTLARYPGLQAIGVAGTARSRGQTWMRERLPAIFSGLKALGAPLVHYKVCSTFDSAPDVGSIGLAADLGRDALNPTWIPLVVGAPEIGRYQVFGTLFAASGPEVYRLDRHPVMSRHPVTPMNEADLLRHLSHQTTQSMGNVDFLSMTSGRSDVDLETAIANGCSIVGLDVFDDETLKAAGRLIDETNPGFAVGSQGVEYALVAHWRATGRIPAQPEAMPLKPTSQLFAVSGSCAQTTADQIAHAEAKGFAILDVDASASVDPGKLAADMDRVETEALSRLSQGQNVLVSTARGPDDLSVARMNDSIAQSGVPAAQANQRLGRALGELVRSIRSRTRIARVAICGGDSSGHALGALQADALSAIAPLAPGAPLCRVHAAQAPDIDGLEVTLKGGQMGAVDFFEKTLKGAA